MNVRSMAVGSVLLLVMFADATSVRGWILFCGATKDGRSTQ